MERRTHKDGSELGHDGQTLATSLTNQLRADIMGCRLEPGQTLRFDWLRETYKISISPLREALTRLCQGPSLPTIAAIASRRCRSRICSTSRWRAETEALASASPSSAATTMGSSYMFHAGEKLRGGGQQLFDPEWEKRHRRSIRFTACGSPMLADAQLNNQWRYRLLSAAT